jgi:hypothetical protein
VVKRGLIKPVLSRRNDQKTSPRGKFWNVHSDPMLVDLEPVPSTQSAMGTTIDAHITWPNPSTDLPMPSKRWTEPKCSINNNGPNRQTLEIKIGCQIKGIHPKSDTGPSWVPFKEDWTRLVKLEGCEYSITIEQMKTWLSNFGEILSPIVEDCFEDSESNEGVNALGTYSVKMKLTNEIPQLLPMHGKRVKIYYEGIDKLCFNCFGKYHRKFC